MLKTSHLTRKNYRLQPWKNGQGETTEIAVDGLAPYRWRVSSATLSHSAPFSPYPDYHRIILLVNGGPVILQHTDGGEKMLSPYRPYAFRGNIETFAKVSLPAVDFNVFTLSKKAKASIYPTFFKTKEEFQFPLPAGEHLLFCCEGEIEVFEPNSNVRVRLKAGETFQISRLEEKEFLNLKTQCVSEKASALWVVIHLF